MTNSAVTHTPPELADLPVRAVLAIDGEGRPEGATFQSAVAFFDQHFGGEALLEGAYWSGDDPLSFDLTRPDGWRWVLAAPAASELATPAEGVRYEVRAAERVARLVHHGPYEDEGPSLEALHVFIRSQGLQPAGPHTEVYLTDPRTVSEAALRTELRIRVR